MRLTLDLDLLAAVIPQAVRMRGLFQGKPMQPEGDLWDHSLLVLELLPAEPTFTLAMAALLHDVGKPFTRSIQHGRWTFHNHEQVGAEIAEKVARRLRLSNFERDRIAWLVKYHQYLGEATRLREAKLKRILAEPGIDELLLLHRADAMATTGDTSQIDYCEAYLRDEPSGPINPPPLLTGHDLARHGFKPGPQFKELLDRVREAQLDGMVHSKREALEWVDSTAAAREARPEGARPAVAGRTVPAYNEAVLVSGDPDRGAGAARWADTRIGWSPPCSSAAGSTAPSCASNSSASTAVVQPIYIRSGCAGRRSSSPRCRGSSPRSGRPGSCHGRSCWKSRSPTSTAPTGAPSATPCPGPRPRTMRSTSPGRNLLLTVKAAVWCRLRECRTLALGSLGSNPFPDSTPEFFADLERLSTGRWVATAAHPAVRDAPQGGGPGPGPPPAAPSDVLVHRPARTASTAAAATSVRSGRRDSGTPGSET